ncbi:MAG: FAD-dependent oxidoreductase [Planctomycetota bacterium]
MCVVGGGFGGLYTALRLDELVWPNGAKPRVTLVDRSERFVFKPLLYELLNSGAEEWQVAPRFDELLAPTGVEYVRGAVRAVDYESDADAAGRAGAVTVSAAGDGGEEEIPYDWLVVATGAVSRLEGVEGAKELAMPFGTLEDARAVRARLEALEARTAGGGAKPTVVVVGGGYAGVELAVTVAERMGPGGALVRLVDGNDEIMKGAADGQREAAKSALNSTGVVCQLGGYVDSLEKAAAPEGAEDDAKVIITVGGEPIEADAVLWTVGMVPATTGEGGVHAEVSTDGAEADADAEAGDKAHPHPFPFPLNSRNMIEADATLRVPGFSRVFAVGDVASADVASATSSADAPLSATAQVAFQQADYAAWNLWAAINGRQLLPFRYQHLGEMMSLGKTSGALSSDGLGLLPEKLTLDGLVGGAARRAAYLYRMPTNEHRAKVAVSWAADPLAGLLDMAKDRGAPMAGELAKAVRAGADAARKSL